MEYIQFENITKVELFELEANYDEGDFHKWIDDNWAIAYTASVIYAVVIFATKQYMENRQKFELRYPLAAWSSALAIFSIMGTIRTSPLFFYDLYTHGLHYSLCDNAYYFSKPTNFWCSLFTLSKLVELGDTLFIVLRKQPLIFLHYYHHITVLMYVWFTYPYRTASGRWFLMMNYFVHSLMYTYYALRAMRFKVPRFVNKVLTTLQLCQMFVGFCIAIYLRNVMESGIPCATNWMAIKYSFLMYVSYFILFAKFFYDTYIKPKNTDLKKSATNGITSNGVAASKVSSKYD